MKACIYNGLSYNYTDSDQFVVELGRYQTSYKRLQVYQVARGLDEPHRAAIQRYENLFVSDGYKKRLSLVSLDGERHVLARELSEASKPVGQRGSCIKRKSPNE